jgi:hypothetical protein
MAEHWESGTGMVTQCYETKIQDGLYYNHNDGGYNKSDLCRPSCMLQFAIQLQSVDEAEHSPFVGAHPWYSSYEYESFLDCRG